MIELRENGVLISSGNGCLIELLRYSEILSVSIGWVNARRPPFDLTVTCGLGGLKYSVQLSEFGNANKDCDGVMAKVKRFMTDLMDRCAGPKIGKQT
jgi:hypothetical protein